MKEGAVEFLAKPFNHQRLLKLLRDTLNGETCGRVLPRLAIAS